MVSYVQLVVFVIMEGSSIAAAAVSSPCVVVSLYKSMTMMTKAYKEGKWYRSTCASESNRGS